jgi:CRISPR-associated endonuclease/helicase Cas3
MAKLILKNYPLLSIIGTAPTGEQGLPHRRADGYQGVAHMPQQRDANTEIDPAGLSVLDRLLAAVGVAQPYPWQREAFALLCAGKVPASVRAPTAAGKTALMVCWLAALIEQARASGGDPGRISLPRRYVVVVNRRVLVDAASDLALGLAQALEQPALADLRGALAALSMTGRAGTGEPLTVSTLRGQRADACDWATDPSRPAIIAATPDMAGSRLLFGGYGLGRSRRATHAGLLGVDTLLVHDEAHLAPALTALLRRIETLAAPGAARIGRPALSVIEMSATPRDLSGGDRPVVLADPAQDSVLAQRLRAVKRLYRQDGAGVAELVKQAAAAVRAGQAVLVALNSPEDAAKAAAALCKAGIDGERVACLTGTLRGLERDRLAASPVLARLAGDGRRDESGGGAVLVATAAGEVGMDLDADVLLCDAVTLDRLVQRAGRCNRRGLGQGRIVVFPAAAKPPKALAARIEVALALLEALPPLAPLPSESGGTARDASPQALSALLAHPRYADAIEPAPAMRVLAREVVDLYALTSVPLAVPQRALYLHGVQDDEAEVRLAWRQLPQTPQWKEWLEAWPVGVREQARLPGHRADKVILARLAAWTGAGPAALVVSADGERVESVPAGVRRLALRGGDLVLLAAEAGGLNAAGLPDALAAEAVSDVSGDHIDARGYVRGAVTAVELARTVSEARGERWRVVGGGDAAEDGQSDHPSLTAALTAALPGWRIAWHDAPPTDADGEDWHGPLRVWPERTGVRAADDGDSAGQSRADRALDEHLWLAGRAAARLLAVLPVAADCAQAVHQGASDHDDGKAAARWQAAIGRRPGDVPLAKSVRPWFDSRRSAGYRHELGSVAAAPAGWRTAGGAALWRHLVAAHHGWARPGFTAAALVHPGCTDAARQAGDDFGRLHDTLGPWALAYLEALLKAADIQAELMADTLAHDADATGQSDAIPPAGPALPQPVAACWRVAVNVRNPGEYFACLGVVALVRALRPGGALALRWEPGHFVLQGVDDAGVRALLGALCAAEVVPVLDAATGAPQDTESSDGDTKEPGWPALHLVLPGGPTLPLHAWIDDSGRGNSEWKWSGGRTLAVDITRRLLQGCAELLTADGPTSALPLFAQGAGLAPSNPDTARFRFDASGAWSAVEVGYSLEKENRPKSCRPWVELLAMLGVQTFAPPPAGRKAGGWAYHTWTHALTPVVAMAAVRGHHLSCDRRLLLRTLLTNEGKYADALIADLTSLAPPPSAVLIV